MYLNAMRKYAQQRGISMEELVEERRIAMQNSIKSARESRVPKKIADVKASAASLYLSRPMK